MGTMTDQLDSQASGSVDWYATPTRDDVIAAGRLAWRRWRSAKDVGADFDPAPGPREGEQSDDVDRC
jgi:hypothetical protein